jgi:hypothetical protein
VLEPIEVKTVSRWRSLEKTRSVLGIVSKSARQEPREIINLETVIGRAHCSYFRKNKKTIINN